MDGVVIISLASPSGHIALVLLEVSVSYRVFSRPTSLADILHLSIRSVYTQQLTRILVIVKPKCLL